MQGDQRRKMNRIQGVSLPRSGHNMLVIHLKQYFGQHVDCPDYRKRLLPSFSKRQTRRRTERLEVNSTFHYCEYYYSCRSIPCPDANNKFQKSHDFQLDLPVLAEESYLVQTRHPMGLLISWYELRLKKGRELDTVAGWLRFVQRKIPYVDGFLDKWIPATKSGGLLLDYDDYLSRPVDGLSRAIQLFVANVEPDVKKIERIVKDVRPAKDDSQFRYFHETPPLLGRNEYRAVKANSDALGQMLP